MKPIYPCILLLTACAVDPIEPPSEVGEASLAIAADDEELEDPGPDPDPNEPPIIGGTACVMPSAIYMAAGGKPLCSATLVAPDVVLTALHCMSDATQTIPRAARDITFGRGDRSCGMGEVRGAAMVKHPQHGHSATDDLVLIKLDAPIPGAVPATLADSRATAGMDVVAQGYGTQGFNHGVHTGESMCGTTKVTSKPLPGDPYATALKVGSGVCHGDSGGGVYAAGTTPGTNILVGTTIMVESGVDGQHCGGDAYVAPIQKSWILQSIEILRNMTACTPGSTSSCRPSGAACFQGDPQGNPFGACAAGTATCDASGHWGECQGYVGPSEEVCGDGVDNDCDANTDEGCVADPEACSLQCPNGTSPNPATCLCETVCGDAMCNGNETRSSCPWDCSQCGDHWCQGWEVATCSRDCTGNNVCICGWDCPTGTPGCPNEGCGNGVCEPELGEDQWSCVSDCAMFSTCICGVDCPANTPGCPSGLCGDGQCDVVSEDPASCPSDCGGGGGGVHEGGGHSGSGPDTCGDDYWWWLVDNFGWDDAEVFYAEDCWLNQ